MSQEAVKFIRKSNDLVEAKYKFDIWETRIFTRMLTMIHRDDEDFKEYRIYLRDIVSEFGLVKTKDAYEWLRQGARSLMKKTFLIPYELDGAKRSFETPVVSSLDSAVLDDKKLKQEHLYISISFHPKMKPYLLQLKSQFTIYDVRNILKLPSTYSIRIYELLKQYEKIGRRRFEVDELKEILGIGDEYPMYANFKQRVIQKAQKDLAANTDLMFEFEEIKRGRAVFELVFLIRPNAARRKTAAAIAAAPAAKTASRSVFFDENYPLIKEWIGEATFSKWCEELPETQIKNGIETTLAQLERGAAIGNVGGYLNKMVHEKTPEPTEPPSVLKAKKVAEKATQNAARKLVLEEKLHRLRSAHFARQLDRVGELFVESPDFQAKTMAAARENLFSGYDESLTPEQNFVQNRQFRAAVVNRAIRADAAAFAAIDAEDLPAIKVIEKELRGL